MKLITGILLGTYSKENDYFQVAITFVKY